MAINEGSDGKVETPHDDGDALAFLEASKVWPTRITIAELPHTHGGEAARLIGCVVDVVDKVLRCLSLRRG